MSRARTSRVLGVHFAILPISAIGICDYVTYMGISTSNPDPFRFGLRVDFLVGLCFALNLWDWSTRDVVVFLVKACTEQWRCRFAGTPF